MIASIRSRRSRTSRAARRGRAGPAARRSRGSACRSRTSRASRRHYAPCLRQERDHAEEGEHADRQVDVEHPAPAVILGQPAAEHRAEHRARPSRRRRTAPSRSPGAPADRCRAAPIARAAPAPRRTCPAGSGTARSATSDCAMPHSIEATVKPATRDEEQPLDAEPPGEKAGRRRHDRGRDDIGGQHPVDLVLAGRDAALDVRQRDVGDGRVQRLHQGREDHAER